jgi:8-oxo-dGTP pyrophosphatase MutT (NUDIX family)
MRRERASAVCVHDGALLCVRLRDPLSRVARLFVPGGRIERGESAAEAAARETLEETGYAVEIDHDARISARYPYVWMGLKIAVTTHFFRARLADDRPEPLPTHDATYNEGACWLPLDQLEAELSFHLAILEAVRSLVR